jgi:hypothetical protein
MEGRRVPVRVRPSWREGEPGNQFGVHFDKRYGDKPDTGVPPNPLVGICFIPKTLVLVVHYLLGDIAERILVPGLLDKFEQFGFSFGDLSHNVKWKEKEHNLSMELDALLENGKQAMVVEVKAKLDKADIEEQVKRMEKVRRYADLKGDKRQFFCAMAALAAPDRVIEYALSKGFYMIMPSGEDVKVTKPVSGPMVW